MLKRSITGQEYNLLRQLLSMHETSLIKSLPKVLSKYYHQGDILYTQDYIYVIGDIPVGLIAHLDTVHAFPPATIYHDSRQGVLWTPEGLGADDRAGVFSIVQILEQGYRPSVIFTTGEEVGGVGAKKIIEAYPSPLSEILFLIELDRQGSRDAVYYDCGNRDFEDFITRFGFTTECGSFSDIAIIGPAWDRASVNLSIGYINEHLATEMLFYRDMFATIDKVVQILDNHGDIIYDYQPNIHRLFSYYNERGVEIQVCDCCANAIEVSNIIQVGHGKSAWYLCRECAEEHTNRCRKCG